MISIKKEIVTLQHLLKIICTERYSALLIINVIKCVYIHIHIYIGYYLMLSDNSVIKGYLLHQLLQN